MESVLFNQETGKFVKGFVAEHVFQNQSMKMYFSRKGTVVLDDQGHFVDENLNIVWNGPVKVEIVKNGKTETVKAKAVHYNEDYHEDFRIIEPLAGGIIIVKAKDNEFVAELPYQYCHHKDYHVVCKKNGKEGVINCYALVENGGVDDESIVKIPFNYYHIKLGKNTFGLEENKRLPMVYFDKEKNPLNKRMWGKANSIAGAIEQAPDLGDRLLEVPSDEYPGLVALFSTGNSKIVMDGKKSFVDKIHYFIAVEPDKEDGTKGRAIAYNKHTFEPLP